MKGQNIKKYQEKELNLIRKQEITLFLCRAKMPDKKREN